MAQITPPIGFNLFVLQGMTGHEMSFISARGVSYVPDHGTDGVRADFLSGPGNPAARQYSPDRREVDRSMTPFSCKAS